MTGAECVEMLGIGIVLGGLFVSVLWGVAFARDNADVDEEGST